MAPSLMAPSFNHYRWDSALCPCAICVQELTTDQKMAALKEAGSIIGEWIEASRDPHMPSVPPIHRIAELVALPYLVRFAWSTLDNLVREQSDIRAAVVAKMAPAGSPIEPHEWEPAASMTTLEVVKNLVASNLDHLNQRMRSNDDREKLGEENRRLLGECSKRNIEINGLRAALADRDAVIMNLRRQAADPPVTPDEKKTLAELRNITVGWPDRCAECVKDPDPRGPSACFACRSLKHPPESVRMARSAIAVIELLLREQELATQEHFDHFIEYKRRRNEQFAAYEKLVTRTNQEIAELTDKVARLADKGVVAGQKSTITYLMSERDRLQRVAGEAGDSGTAIAPEVIDRFARSPSTGMGPLTFDNALARRHGWTNVEIAAFWEAAAALYKRTSNRMHERYPHLYDLRHPEDPIYIGPDENGKTLKLDPP